MNISVIIPYNYSEENLILVINKICNQTKKPIEIIVVDSSNKNKDCSDELNQICVRFNIKLIYKKSAHAYPGKARNIGLSLATSEILAFIDVQTIPRQNWLEDSLNRLSETKADGVWGSTCYQAGSSLEKLVRDGLYGKAPLKTLPGSLFKSDVFARSGLFINWVRAGEDTEWMDRLQMLKLNVVSSTRASVDYTGLIDIDFKKLLTKWLRNYSASHSLPLFSSQKILIWLILIPYIIVIAFNWNWIVANWSMDSPFYIDHVTKITIFSIPIVYFLLRGFFIPFKRGVNLLNLLPVRFIAIGTLCLVTDFAKILVLAGFRKNN